MSAKILCLDLETAPITAHVWGLRDQNIGLNQIMSHPRVIGIAAKWIDARGVSWKSEYHDSRSEMLEWAHGLLDQADIMVSYNGQGFDAPWLYAEFAKEDIVPPSPFKHIDLYKVARKLRLPSYKLAYVSQHLGIGTKIDTGGHDLWTRCLERTGDEQRKAWSDMRRYAKQDVALLPPLFYKLRPYFPATVNLAVYDKSNDGKLACQKCERSEHLMPRGYAYTAQRAYPQHYCDPAKGGCGGWTRDTKASWAISAAGVQR